MAGGLVAVATLAGGLVATAGATVLAAGLLVDEKEQAATTRMSRRLATMR